MLQRPKGTKDILPQDVYTWQYIEDLSKNIFNNYQYYQ